MQVGGERGRGGMGRDGPSLASVADDLPSAVCVCETRALPTRTPTSPSPLPFNTLCAQALQGVDSTHDERRGGRGTRGRERVQEVRVHLLSPSVFRDRRVVLHTYTHVYECCVYSPCQPR